MSMLLRSATFADGATGDVRITGSAVADVGPRLEAPAAGETVVDLQGWLLLPAFAEPHAHLDKAFLAERIPNPAGDLLGAINAMQDHRHLITFADTVERAERAARLLAANGTAVIRSHADTTTDHGLRSVEALVEVRRRLGDLVDLQIVALAGWPITGTAGADTRALLVDAIAAGADLVGGCPHLEDDAAGANQILLDIAGELGVGLDLHTDETLDPGVVSLEDLAHRVQASQFPFPVTASHCVSLGMLDVSRQQVVADAVAAARIGVVTLPQTNLFLQGRDHLTGTPRGITAIRALHHAGVHVAAGGDNLQDPFNPMGRGDPLEAANLLITAAHLLPQAALDSVSGAAHRVLGAEPPAISPGARADLVALRADTVRQAIAQAPSPRIVIRRGRLLGDATAASHPPPRAEHERNMNATDR